MIALNVGYVEGLPETEQIKLNSLVNIYNYHLAANETKKKYYNGHISLQEVNLGIALPISFNKLDIGCSWGAKAVDVLAARSMFDGFVSENGAEASTMTDIVKRNRMIAEYAKACRDELLYGVTFAVPSGEPDNARVRFYSPQCAAASWSAVKGRIDCGFAFQDAPDDESDINWQPMYINLFTDTDTWVLSKESGCWAAERHPHKFGRPMMVALAWNPSSDKPFGQSRIKRPIRKLIQGYVRTIADATIGLEFATSPQKYLLGVTDEQYEQITSNKFKQYVGSIIASSSNPETGQNPAFGQLQQGNIEPHVQMLRLLATQFSAATGLPVTDTGVISDSNPTSSDAILAQTQTLVTMAEQLNTSNGDALQLVAHMAQAIELGMTPDTLPDDNRNVVAHFKNPAMPNLKVYGKMSSDGIMQIGKAGLKDYGTGAHEVAHAFDFYKSGGDRTSYSEELVEKARKNLKLRRNSKEYMKQLIQITGSAGDAEKPYEVFAFGIETHMSGIKNDLSKEIFRLATEETV